MIPHLAEVIYYPLAKIDEVKTVSVRIIEIVDYLVNLVGAFATEIDLVIL